MADCQVAKIEEDRSSRYRNNSKELDEWFYAVYYMDPQPQSNPTYWFTPEDDEIFNVGELAQIPRKSNPNSHTSAATTSTTSIHKRVSDKQRKLKELSDFISITMGLGPVSKSIKPPIENKTQKIVVRKSVVPPVKKVVPLLPPLSSKMNEEKKVDHVLNNKRKMNQCDFRGFEATKQVFDNDRINQVKKQKTNQGILIQKSMEEAVSKAKPKSKPSFRQKLTAMASHNKKHHNFQPLVY